VIPTREGWDTPKKCIVPRIECLGFSAFAWVVMRKPL